MQHAAATDAVHNLLIHRDAELAGVAAVAQERIAAFLPLEELCGVVINVLGGDAGADDFLQLHEDAGRYLAGLAELADFVRIAYGDAVCHGVQAL